jgi:hypothetical protein
MAMRMAKRIDRTAVPPARIRTVSEISTIRNLQAWRFGRCKSNKRELIKPS